MRLLRRAKNVELFDRCAASFIEPSFYKLMSTPHGRRYYRLVDPGARDHSFMLVEGEQVFALVECNESHGQLSRFGLPLEIRMLRQAPWHVRTRMSRDAFAELGRIVAETKAEGMSIRTSTCLDPDGITTSALLHIASPRLEVRSEIDLELSEDEIFADLRKGHRHQVRFTRQMIETAIIDREHPSKEAFDRFREFHAKISGRVTRSKESWDAMCECVHDGQGSLILGTFQGELVAGTLVMDAAGTAYYASGVYDREYFDKPVAHGTLFASVIEARRRGNKRFDVGMVPVAGQGYSDKEISIGLFKQGFSSRLVSSNVWKVPAASSPAGIAEMEQV